MTHDACPIDPRVMTHDARPIDPRVDHPSTLVLEPLERPCAHEFANECINTPETDDSIGRGRALGATTRRTRRWTRAMALNREFYAACFARSALGRSVATETKSSETSFAAAAKKEFDLTSFLKDLAAVRARDATARGWARAIASG